MSGVSWITNSRKYLVFVGLSTGANFWCLLDHYHVQMSRVCWIINRRKFLVFVGLLTDANFSCFLDY